MRTPLFFQQLAQDSRYALRSMRRQPGFSIAAISMLTIGLGLLAGGYTVFNGLFLRGWAVPDSARVFRAHADRMAAPTAGYIIDGFSIGAYKHLRANATTSDFVAFAIEYFSVRPDGAARGTHTPGMFVSDNLIETLRVPLQGGTGLAAATMASAPGILISDGVWRQIFGADPQIIGRTAWLNDVPTTIIGVTAPGFDGLGERPLDVIVEISSARMFGRRSVAELITDETACCVSLAGRIREGWSRTQVREELALLTAQYRRSIRRPGLSVTLASTVPSEGIRRSRQGNAIGIALALIGVGIVLVMLLTCANVGNLYLARSLRREREIAVRLSLGASRSRVVRQLVTEGLVLASIAGTGALLATTGVPFVLRLLEDNATATMFASDWRVAAFTAAGVVGTCLLVSLAPALQTTRIAWRGANATMSARTGRTRGVVLAAQIAIAAVLVLSATLIARGIGHAVSVRTDFALRTTTAVTLEAPVDRGYDAKKVGEIRTALTRAVEQSDLHVGLADTSPGSGRAGLNTSVRRVQSDIEFRAQLVPLSASAFAVLDVTLAGGRWASDDPAAGEAVINQTLARQMWPGESAVGKTVTLSFNQRHYSIVGIARDAHLTALDEVEPMVHISPSLGLPVLLARTAPGLEQRLKALVASVDPELIVTVTPLSQAMKQALENAMIGAAIAGGLAALALLLAIVGVFGVFSYLIEERRREIGIRLALGASRTQIGAALLHASRGAVAGGLIAGLTLSAIAGRSLRRFLFGLSPADPVSYMVVALVLGAAALIATAIPVRRALRVDPAVTLKAE